ncbi:Thioredoxin-like fold protein [Metarhizium album ARSEF 1941]|uniref:Thioredoxin-like fold protein n=1 Tax=Metarhizium album (strain ARSEF 1941) TaxID=1081103 RepID=A0A0B2WXQ0_METAS|nr:Thioredoxin-like fold protein [Metarhizium album ARSEF 1941]KHN98798.1 Thioredoxin-like fold protein [Metarhizium album ARSEF 1941]
MSGLKAGDFFPDGVKFFYVEPSGDDINTCGIPRALDASAEFRSKKVVLVSVPGAFTPVCSSAHLPSYVANRAALEAKGVDMVVMIAYNDPYVMSAWAKAHGITDAFIICASDPGFSKSIGWNDGERTARYAIVVDHGKVVYAEKEDGSGIERSGAEGVLANL